MIITKPSATNGWLDTYIQEVEQNDLLLELQSLKVETTEFFKTLPAEVLLKRYSPGKWSVLEVLLHLVDSERVFAYRALRFSRLDPTPLPGYDENLFVANSFADERGIKSVMQEYTAQRDATIALFDSMTTQMWDATGTANNTSMSVRGLGFAICGHERHHLRVIRERYL